MDSLTADQVMTMLSAALKNRDWLAVEGAMKLLALKDPEKAQAALDMMTVVANTEAGQ
jgi:hypothetical protein